MSKFPFAFALLLFCISNSNAQGPFKDQSASAWLDSAKFYFAQEKAPQSMLAGLRALSIVDTADQMELTLQIHMTLSKALAEMKAFSQSVRHIKMANRLAEKLENSNTIHHYFRYASIGLLLLEDHKTNDALDVFKNSISIAKKTGTPRTVTNALNNVAFVYLTLKDRSKAVKYLRLAKNQLNVKSRDDSIMIASVYDNFSLLYHQKGRLDSALWYKRLVVRILKQSEPENIQKLLERQFSLTELLVESKQAAKALTVLNTIAGDTLYLRPKERLQWTQKFAHGRKKCLFLLGRKNEFLKSQERELHLLQMLYKQKEEEYLKSQNAIGQYELQMVQQQLVISELERKRNHTELEFARESARNRYIIAVSLTALVILTLILAIIIYRKRNQSFKEKEQIRNLEIENQKLQQEKLQQELDSKKRDLTELALDNTRKKEWTETILSKLNGLSTSDESEQKQAIRKIKVEMNNQLKLERRVEALQQNIDSVNNEFYQKLNEKFPKLTKNERELCGLIKLGLSGKEIANIRHIETRSVIRAKNRLRNKIGLSPNSDIKIALDKI